MSTPSAYVEATRRIELACTSVANPRTLRHQLVAEIQRAVGFDAYVWVLTDPETSVGSAPLADVPPECLPRLPELIRLKYLSEVNRWTQLRTTASLVEATGGALAGSRLWQELLQEFGVVDVASSVFRDRFGCWAFLDLWRSGAAVAFTPEEVAFLTAVNATVTRALRRSQAQTFSVSDQPAERAPGPAVLLLSGKLDVLAQTPQTQAYLRVLVPPAEDATPVPAAAYNVAGQLLAREQGIDDNAPMARVHVSQGRWLTLRAARMGTGPSVGQDDIAVTIEQASPSERLDLFARAVGLAPRERELVELLVLGCDTRELARRMGLSGHTVQDHLKSIFTKTSTNSRKALVSQVLGA